MSNDPLITEIINGMTGLSNGEQADLEARLGRLIGDLQGLLESSSSVALPYHGIEDAGALTFDASTHVLTMAAGRNTYWYKGEKFTTPNAITCDIDSYETLTTNTLYRFYFDNLNGILKCSDSAWDLVEQVPVAYVFWNGSAGAVNPELHNHTRNLDWHGNAHLTIGTRYESGLAITYPTTVVDGSLQIGAGVIMDEDFRIAISQQTTMRGWHQVSNGTYTFTDYAFPYLGTAGQPYYLDTDDYTLKAVSASHYACYWVYASNDQDRPIYIIPTQASTYYGTVAAARAETAPGLMGLNLSPEMKLIYRFIYRGNGDFQEMNDYRLSSPVPGGGSTATTAAAVAFTPSGGIAATTVQAALEELDSEKAAVTDLAAYVPYTGATGDVSLGAYNIKTDGYFLSQDTWNANNAIGLMGASGGELAGSTVWLTCDNVDRAGATVYVTFPTDANLTFFSGGALDLTGYSLSISSYDYALYESQGVMITASKASVERTINLYTAAGITVAFVTGGGLGLGNNYIYAQAGGAIAIGAGSCTSTSTNDASVAGHTHVIDSSLARSAITITGGNGMAAGTGGSLAANRTITLGTPGALSASTTDAVTTNSHTHSIGSTIARSAITITAGNGLTGGGSLASNRTIDVGAGNGISVAADAVAVDLTYGFTWTGAHTFQNTMTARTIVPETTDTYDLGSSLKLWRSGYLSNLNAVVFAESTAQLLGGWLIIPKDAGDLGAAVAAGDSTVNFGKAMTVGDWVLIRAHDTGGTIKAEYMLVGSNVSGTTYNVTRDLAGAHGTDPAWAAGTPYMIMGQSGAGRIELNAYDTPRIQLITQGAAYNTQTELVRIGDLNGGWGYTGETYGVAIGARAASTANLTMDATNGLRIFTNATLTAQWAATGNITLYANGAATVSLDATSGDATFGEVGASKFNMMWDASEGDLLLRQNTTAYFQVDGSASLLKFGSNVAAAGTTAISIFGAAQTYNSESLGANDLLIGDNSANKANIWWDYSAGTLNFRGGTTTQVSVNTAGALTAGAGAVSLDATGIVIFAPNTNNITPVEPVVTQRLNFVGAGLPNTDGYDILYISTYQNYWDTGIVGSGVFHSNARMISKFLDIYDTDTFQSTLTVGASDETETHTCTLVFTVYELSSGSVTTTIGANASVNINCGSTTALVVEQDGVHDNVLVVDTGNGQVLIGTGTAVASTVMTIGGTFGITDAKDVILGTTTGTKIGTATNQKLAFFNSAPVVQQSGEITTALSNLGLVASPTVSILSGHVYLGDTADGNVTVGITINQGGNDDRIITFKSSDVAHGFGISETDTYGAFGKISGTDGGCKFEGMTETTVGVQITAYSASCDTGSTSTSVGSFLIDVFKTDNTGAINSDANHNLIAVRAKVGGSVRTVMIVDEDGDIRLDGSSSNTVWDEHDDVMLLSGLRGSLMGGSQALSEFIEAARPVLERTGVVTYNPDGHHFIHMKALHWLEIDAMRQLYGRLERLEARLH